MSNPSLISRRRFLGQAGCAALGTTGLFSTAINLGLASRLAAQEAPTDYKALICLFLLGGNDSFNMIVPTTVDSTQDQFANYASIRGNLALAKSTLKPITDQASGHTYGLHSQLGAFQSLFAGTGGMPSDMAFVANVGSLRKPFINAADYHARASDWPVGLFSHSDQQQQWQTCTPHKRNPIGWAGRMMDQFQNLNTNLRRSTYNISLSGVNIMQTGNSIVPYSMKASGATGLADYDPELMSPANLNQRVTAARSGAIDDMMQAVYRNIFEKTYTRVTRDAQESFEMFDQSLEDVTYSEWNASSGSDLEKQLKMIARIISAYSSNGEAKRQTFFVSVGGWDTHSELFDTHTDLLATVNEAVSRFWNYLPSTLKPKVTLFSASDFGRTLTSNGDGSDHAWGGHQFVLGGSVNAGKIFGEYPLLVKIGNDISVRSSLDSELIDVGQGRIIPGYSVEEYLYPMLNWFGAFGTSGTNGLDLIFPDYGDRFGTGGMRKTYPLYAS